MDDNTAAVLKLLIEIAGITSVFWSAAFVIRWQRDIGVDDDDEEDDGDDDEDETESCPGASECHYKTMYRVRYGLEDKTLLRFLLSHLVSILAAGVLGFMLGALLF